MTESTKEVSRSQRISDFFYTDEIPYGLALMRIALPLILLCVVIPRWQMTRELYSNDGAVAPIAEAYGYSDFLPVPSPTVAVGLMTALAFCLLASSIGWHTRIALWASWGLYTYLNMLDALSTLTKYSVISSHVLLLLALSNCGTVWSLDAARNPDITRPGPRWTRRLIQLLIGLIYFGAAFTKVHTTGFASGDQIRYWLLTDLNRENPLGEWLAMYPAIIVGMAHIALVFQFVFIFIAWRGVGRTVMLSLGAAFHLSTVWLLGLFIFPPVMLATYLAWLNEDDVAKLRTLLASRLKGPLQTLRSWTEAPGQSISRLGIPSGTLFMLACGTTVCAGIFVENALDLYGENRPGGRYVLAAISPQRESQLFSTPHSMREADKFFSFEIGTQTLGGTVVGRKSSFAANERILAQVNLVPPHEDLFIICTVEDPEGNEIHSASKAVTRDMMRITFDYMFCSDTKPGTYRFVISSKQKRVMWRDIEISGDQCSGL